MRMLGPSSNLIARRLLSPALVLAFFAACSSGLDNGQASRGGPRQNTKKEQSKPRFRNPQMDALYKAAKAAPHEFDPVYAYAKTVTDVCMNSLIDTNCEACAEGTARYKPRSALEPQYWPIIDEALSMLEELGKVLGLAADQSDQLLATKGRLLWLAGRSVEEQPMIFEYAAEHPDAVAVVRRRLELLRESGDAAGLEAQCTLSRAKTKSSSEAARADLLTACVALNPKNREGRSDLLDYAKYLPNLTTSEEAVYRANLVQRCETRATDGEAQCAEGCACGDDDAGSKLTGKCKRACGRCRKEAAQRLRL
jgi:hypothetical protein